MDSFKKYMKFVFLKTFTYRKVEHHYQSKNSIHKHALEQLIGH